MTIAMIRHGQTDWNLAGRVQGHTDIPLNATGKDQAFATAKALEGAGWGVVLSSPLLRARQSAEIIADHLGLPLLDAHPGLIEQHYGEAEGTPVAELATRWPDRNFAGGEAVADVAARAMRTLDELWREHDGERVLAVTHGAYIRRAIATILGSDYQLVPGIMNASVNEFYNRDSGWQVLTVNGQPAGEVLGAGLGSVSGAGSGVDPHPKNITPAGAATPPSTTTAPKFKTIPGAATGAADPAFCTIDGECF